jgi:2-keto-4-pentenoate hydratase/2-oxohepta-3-ene-1,7-dioic acid hydratase in catechol pathway
MTKCAIRGGGKASSWSNAVIRQFLSHPSRRRIYLYINQLINIGRNRLKLGRFSAAGRVFLGRVEGERVAAITARIPDAGDRMEWLIENWPNIRATVAALPAESALSELEILAPVARPGKILGIGLNYKDHIAESALETPKHQVWFSKAVTSVAGPFDPILRPVVSKALDYEAELVFVIGKRCKHVTVENAQDAIFGYCAGNDVSVRDWQMRTGQFMMGKTFDTHAPFGPWITTADGVDANALEIRTFVNGEERQRFNSSNMVFHCAEQVAHLSQAMTLEPGDIVFTGTSNGVGGLMKPPRFLRPDDVVRIEIDGLGAIENRVVQETL